MTITTEAPRGLIPELNTQVGRELRRILESSSPSMRKQVSTHPQPAPEDLFQPTAGFIHPQSVEPLVVDIHLENIAGETFVLDSIELRLQQPGGDTVVWSNKQQAGLVDLILTLNRRERSFQFTFKPKRLPTNAHEFLLTLQYEHCLSKPLTVRIISRSFGVEVLHSNVPHAPLPAPEAEAIALIEDLDAIQRKVKRPILVTPGKHLSPDEVKTINKLRTVLHEGGFPATWSEAALEILPGGIPALLEAYGNGRVAEFRLKREEVETLFGVELPMGTVQYIGQVTLRDEAAVRDAFAHVTNDDEAIRVELVVVGDGKVRLDYLNWLSAGEVSNVVPEFVTPLPDTTMDQVYAVASRLGVRPRELLAAAVAHLLQQPDETLTSLLHRGTPGAQSPIQGIQQPLSREIAQELLAAWPSLPAEQRALWFMALDSLLPPDTELLETLEQLEDARYLDALSAEDRQTVPMAQALAEMGYAPQ